MICKEVFEPLLKINYRHSVPKNLHTMMANYVITRVK